MVGTKLISCQFHFSNVFKQSTKQLLPIFPKTIHYQPKTTLTSHMHAHTHTRTQTHTWALTCTLPCNLSLKYTSDSFSHKGLAVHCVQKVIPKMAPPGQVQSDWNWNLTSQWMQQLTISLSSHSLASSCHAGQSKGTRWQALINASRASFFISSFLNTMPSLQTQKLTTLTITEKVYTCSLFDRACMCMHVCMKEREREKDRNTQRERGRETDRNRGRQTDRQTERDQERETATRDNGQ